MALELSPLDWVAVVCFGGGSAVAALNQATKDAPELAKKAPWLRLGGRWNYVPLALFLVAGAVWVAARLSPSGEAPNTAAHLSGATLPASAAPGDLQSPKVMAARTTPPNANPATTPTLDNTKVPERPKSKPKPASNLGTMPTIMPVFVRVPMAVPSGPLPPCVILSGDNNIAVGNRTRSSACAGVMATGTGSQASYNESTDGPDRPAYNSNIPECLRLRNCNYRRPTAPSAEQIVTPPH